MQHSIHKKLLLAVSLLVSPCTPHKTSASLPATHVATAVAFYCVGTTLDLTAMTLGYCLGSRTGPKRSLQCICTNTAVGLFDSISHGSVAIFLWNVSQKTTCYLSPLHFFPMGIASGILSASVALLFLQKHYPQKSDYKSYILRNVTINLLPALLYGAGIFLWSRR